MMTGLYVYGSSKPFCRTYRAVPQQDVTKVVNTLLDGSVHVQIIGAPRRLVDIEAILDDTARLAYEGLDASGGLLTLVDISGTYHGRIVEAKVLERVIVAEGKRHYRARFMLAEEVDDR